MFKNNVHVVIMAGGVGSRFWPMSTPDTPKQFIDILGCGRTFIQMTYDRFKELCLPENVWVVTSAKYAQVVKQRLPEIPEKNILLEPCRRNTAPCIAYVSWRIKAKDPNANIVVAPSDHIILNTPHFQQVVSSALDFTEQSDSIVTLGMKPNRPETGYGYIQADLTYSSPRNKNIFRVDQFKEKPDLETAKRYIKSDKFFWNSGLFIWNVKTIVNAFRVYQPAISRIFESLLPYYGTDKEQELINEAYPLCENISVDYAILEKADEIFVYPADFGWSDVGTWGALHMLSPRDDANNALIGPNINVYESRNCIVHTTTEKKVVIQGLDGYIIAEHEDTLLVCKLSEEQRIKIFAEN